MSATLIARCPRCGLNEVERAAAPTDGGVLCETCRARSVPRSWPAPPADEVDRALARVREIRRRYPSR